LSAQSVQLDSSARAQTGRGRHRAPSGPTAVSRARARATVAAVTTGTVAVSGVALAGCVSDVPNDTNAADASVTAPMNLASQLGARATTGPTLQHASLGASAGSSVLGTTTDIAAPRLTPKADVDLRITNPDVTVNANEPIDMAFSLTNQQTHAPLANQLVKVQVKLPTGWATFKHLYTDAHGHASYTARVLTTTQITAIFDGTDALQSAHSDNVGTLHVRPQPQPIPQASRTVARTSLAAAVPTVTPVSTSTSASTLGQKAVYLASLQSGKPYVYGADGPSSFDCSGLVQYVFKQLGRSLPRTAEEQYEATTRVSQYNKQIGDLIFFGTPGNIYHVGIYAGNGKMWAAPHSGATVSLVTIWSTSYSVGRVQ
jgi:cell wall-associated NlpC family hydrolase